MDGDTERRHAVSLEGAALPTLPSPLNMSRVNYPAQEPPKGEEEEAWLFGMATWNASHKKC